MVACEQIAFALAAALAILYFVAFVIHSFSVLLFPYPVAYNEGAILYESTLLAHGQNIYTSLASAPYLGANYPPVYYLLCTLGVHLLGPVLLPGRALSLVAGLCSGLFVFLLLRMGCKGKAVPLLSAGLFFALSAVYAWSTIVKSDMLALLLSLAGLYAWRRFQDGKWFLLAPLAFALSFYTKQTALAAPLAVGVCLLALFRPAELRVHRRRTYQVPNPPTPLVKGAFADADRRRLLLFVVGIVCMIGLPFGLMQVLTHGEFARHVIFYNAKAFSGDQLVHELISFSLGNSGLIAIGLVALWLLRGNSDSLPFRLYFLFGLGFAVFAIGREGASTNYYLDALAGAVLLAGLTLDRIRQSRPAARAALSWLVLVQLVALFHWPGLIEPVKTPQADDRQAGHTIMELVGKEPGEIFAENSAWPVLAGRRLVIDDISTILPLAEIGLWNQSQLVYSFRGKRFSLLLTEVDPRPGSSNPQYLLDRYTPEVLQAIQQNYRVVGRAGDTYLLEPLK